MTKDRSREGDGHHAPPDFVGRDPCIQRLRHQVATVASHGCTVLICGESGTGKELVARQIHSASPRAQGPFIIADCTALPDALIASQLFGHLRGAFTDAKQATLGLFRAAHGGTLLIDEIGEMQLRTQATLLRCIQEHCVLPVGAVNTVHVDVQIMAATHRDLGEMVKRGRFREDLFYRLDVVRIEVPPLRSHRSDVPLLTKHFLEQQAAMRGTAVKTFSSEAMAALESYSWPGNVRELKNVIERATALSESDYLTYADLPGRMRNGTDTLAARGLGGQSDVVPGQSDIAPLHIVERRHIERALRAAEGNQSRAAQMLKVERHRFARMVRRHGLQSLVGSLRFSGSKAGSVSDQNHPPQELGGQWRPPDSAMDVRQPRDATGLL